MVKHVAEIRVGTDSPSPFPPHHGKACRWRVRSISTDVRVGSLLRDTELKAPQFYGP